MGIPVDQAMAEAGATSGTDEDILKFLQNSRDNNQQNTSNLFSDKIVARTIIADKIKANSIEGLEIFTDQISGLSDEMAKMKAQMSSSSAVLSASTEPIISPTETPTGPLAGLSNNLLIKTLAEFWGRVTFKDQVNFEKTALYNQDTAGYAVINVDDDQVDVVFNNEYDQVPVVNASLVVDNDKIADILGENYSFTVTDRNTKGFSIKLGKKAKTDLKFAWSVVSVKDAKTYQRPTPTPLPTIEPTIEPTLFITPTEMPSVGESGTINL
jgi:hypothetical protein